MSCFPFGFISSPKPLLTIEDLIIMALQGKAKAKRVKSVFRQTDAGEPLNTEVSFSIVERNEKVPAVFAKGDEVHPTFHEISNALAHQTLMASSDRKAVSSRSMGSTAGGVPLYKRVNGTPTLVGAIAVAGDHPDQNEAIALAASQGFEPPVSAKDTGFASTEPVEELEIEEFYPDLSGYLAPVSPLEKLGQPIPTLAGLPDVPYTPLTSSNLSLPPIVPTASSTSTSLPSAPLSPMSASLKTKPLSPMSASLKTKPLSPMSASLKTRPLQPMSGLPVLAATSPLPPISRSPSLALPSGVANTAPLSPLSASLPTRPLSPMSGSPRLGR